MYDHAVGNVPFGEGRSGVAGLDPAYANEKNVGNYFVLRTIDKVKPGGLIVLVVPNGMTDGTKYKNCAIKSAVKRNFGRASYAFWYVQRIRYRYRGGRMGIA